MNGKTISEMIDSIEFNGFWWEEEAKEAYIKACHLLCSKGFSLEDVEAMLRNLFESALKEYGIEKDDYEEKI